MVYSRCGGCVHKVHQRILKRQAHIAVQRQTHYTELFFSVALKYIPPGSNPQNVWDAAGHDWHDISSVIWFVPLCDISRQRPKYAHATREPVSQEEFSM
jgi:hypothetical protein